MNKQGRRLSAFGQTTSRFGVVAAALAIPACMNATEQRQHSETPATELSSSVPSSRLDDVLERVFLAGTQTPVWVQVVDGYAVMDDINFGTIETVRREGLVRRRPVNADAFRLAQGARNKDARRAESAADRWVSAIIPYEFASDFPSSRQDLVRYAFGVLERRTALRFVAHGNEEDAIRFVNGGSCYSLVGRVGGVQDISLSGSCESVGTIIHEILHAAGWDHEQCRSDRDQYVIFHQENVIANRAFNFDVREAQDDDSYGPYDFQSVMHYGARDYSSNGMIVLEPRDPNVPIDSLGQRNGPSPGDLASINATYLGQPRRNLTISLSRTELRPNIHETGQIVDVDLGGAPDQLRNARLTVTSSDPSIVMTGGLGAGIFELSTWDGQRRYRITALPKSGSAQLVFRVSTPDGASASATLAVTVSGTATNAAQPFVRSNYYYYGDRVTLNGRVYVNVTLRNLIGTYEPWGSQRTGGFTCAPMTCDPSARASYGGIQLFWIEEGAASQTPYEQLLGPGPQPTGDAGTTPDSGPLPIPDAGITVDGSVPIEPPPVEDAGNVMDARIGPTPNADAASPPENDAGPPPAMHAGCQVAAPLDGSWILVLGTLLRVARRRRRSDPLAKDAT